MADSLMARAKKSPPPIGNRVKNMTPVKDGNGIFLSKVKYLQLI